MLLRVKARALRLKKASKSKSPPKKSKSKSSRSSSSPDAGNTSLKKQYYKKGHNYHPGIPDYMLGYGPSPTKEDKAKARAVANRAAKYYAAVLKK